MTRTQVEIRLVPSKNTVRKAEHPPTYQQAQNMPSSTSLTSVGVESRATFGGNKKRLSRSPSVREDDTSSHADSFEPDDTEEENVETSYIASELTANGGAHDDENGNESETGTAEICINELRNMDEIELEQMQDTSINEYPSNPKAQIGTKLFKGERERQTRFYYDQHTYTVVSRLRAVNKRLSHQLEQQNKLVTTMIEEKKQYLQLIDSLRTEVQMHKQTLRVLHPATPGGGKNHDSSLPVVPRPPHQPSSPRDEKDDKSRAITPRAAASPFRRPPVSPSGLSPRKNPRARTEAQGCSCDGRSHSHEANMLAACMTKLEKAEEVRKNLQQRHAHQLANYSHELSRLERLLEKAHIAIQENENEMRLQRTRQLYCSTPTTPNTAMVRRKSYTGSNTGIDIPSNSNAGRRESLQAKNIFSDDIWKGLLPLSLEMNTSNDTCEDTPREVACTSPVSFTSHVGQAFELLLGHQLLALHDGTLDRSTREWLREVKMCGSQMLTLHHSFQVMACSLQHIAECTHIYQLAETLTEECRELLQAEQVLVLVVDKSEQEFWCRMPSRLANEEIAENKSSESSKPQMRTVRSALPHVNNTLCSPHSISGATPCGLAAFVYHTKRALLLPAGQMTRHPSYSVASDNADRLVIHPSASTLLIPILHANRVLAVVQISGKLTQVQALGLSIALEKCDTFTSEDQALLTILCHFSSGLFPKVAYFTDVESNKVNEETFIQLAPEIFTCLHFDELGKVVIENAKNILDADRCSLFVADCATRTLHNWHSDISGAGVEVYQRSAQKANTGMTIHFGQGIVGLVAETQQAINIPDAYDDPRFNSAWDQKTHYRTKSMLTVPIISNIGTTDKSETYGTDDADKQKKIPDQPKEQTLLGVVQVINKSGGAPFRAKDEFLLQTISKLIALAIENSQLFQRNQELCWNVGKLIAEGDIIEAVISLGTAAEQIIGVEGAAVYIVDPDTHELVTFHHKRRYKIALSKSAYSGSLMEDAVRSQQLTIVNDITKSSSYNAFVDSLNGIPARNVLFAPLLVEDAEGIIPRINKLTKRDDDDDDDSITADSGQKLVGLLQLVNSKGRKTHFDQHDLFLSIVQSQSCSVLAAIVEKQRMLRQKEQIALLLDASMSFFKEMSVVGVINAVYNACVSIFDADTTAHLYVWEDRTYPADKERERHMWTSKILPQAAASLVAGTCAISHSSSTNILHAATDGRTATNMSFVPSLGAQSRKLSVVMDQTLRAPTREGLFQQVLMRGCAVIVKHWIVDDVDRDDEEEDTTSERECSSKPSSAIRWRDKPRLGKYTVKAARSDVRLGFIRHAVVACPVWSSYGQEIVGVLVLLFPRDHPAVAAGSRSEQLSTLPILTRQISGALGVCHDLITVSTRARKMQSMLELSRQAPKCAVSLTLTSRGHLGSFSQPINVCSRAFNARALSAELHPIAASNLTVHSLYMDEEGHRWCFQISGATANEMRCDHYMQWIGNHVDLPAGCSETEVFGKLRMDLQSVYARKEVITGVIDTRPRIIGDEGFDSQDEALEATLPRSLLLKVRQLLWGFADASWQVDVPRASRALFGGIANFGLEERYMEKKMLSRRELEQALGPEVGGAGISLTFHEWDQLHSCFADEGNGLVDVEVMLTSLRPQLKSFPVITYELAPVLDTVTQVVVSVQMLLFS